MPETALTKTHMQKDSEDIYKPLTHKQKLLCKRILSGEYPTIAAAAESIGMPAPSASQILGYQHVSNYLDTQEERQSDKAGDRLRKISRGLNKLVSLLDQKLSKGHELSLVELGALTDLYSKVEQGTVKVLDQIPEYALRKSEGRRWRKWRISRWILLIRWTLAHPQLAQRRLELFERLLLQQTKGRLLTGRKGRG